MNVFFDSSALAKRYIQETGSDRVEAILSSASALGVSVVCLSELKMDQAKLKIRRIPKEVTLNVDRYAKEFREIFGI